MPEGLLTLEQVEARRDSIEQGTRIVFRVRNLYGLSGESIKLPVSESDSIESGQVALTGDPEADESCDIGVIDFNTGELKVRYAAQVVFPGLHELVQQERFSPALLDPVRVVATDECEVASDYSGWRAFGCLEFLPGSPWAGATGG